MIVPILSFVAAIAALWVFHLRSIRAFDRKYPHLSRRALRAHAEQEIPMRDLHDTHFSDKPILASLIAAPATHVHAGDGNGAGGAAGGSGVRIRTGDQVRIDGRRACWSLLTADLYATLDACVALARLDPLVPIAGTEAWAEGDGAYRKRLNLRRCGLEAIEDHDLDAAGRSCGLPRARLAKAEGSQP